MCENLHPAVIIGLHFFWGIAIITAFRVLGEGISKRWPPSDNAGG